MAKRRFARGVKKHIRQEKARIRKMNIDKEEQRRLILELINSFHKELNNKT